MAIHISYFINAIKNLKNWKQYSFHKKEVQTRTLNFITKPNAINLEVDAGNYSVFKEIFIEDFYSIEEVIKDLPPTFTVVDIGANEGFFAAIVLSKNKNAVIHAYEPLPDNLKKIRRLQEMNSSVAEKINLHAAAVTGNNLPVIKLFIKQENIESSTSSILHDFDTKNVNAIEVAATTLNEIFSANKLDEIHLLKMDCEGAEYPILYNTDLNLLRKVKRILAEVHPLDNETRNEKHLAEFLKRNGFAIKTTLFNNGCYYMIASRNE